MNSKTERRTLFNIYVFTISSNVISLRLFSFVKERSEISQRKAYSFFETVNLTNCQIYFCVINYTKSLL